MPMRSAKEKSTQSDRAVPHTARKRITLDRYARTRRAAPNKLWTVSTLALMVFALALVLVYGDRCSQGVSVLFK